jgi:hypothetical protein
LPAGAKKNGGHLHGCPPHRKTLDFLTSPSESSPAGRDGLSDR